MCLRSSASAFVVLWALDQWTYGGEHMRIFVRSLRQIGYVSQMSRSTDIVSWVSFQSHASERASAISIRDLVNETREASKLR